MLKVKGIKRPLLDYCSVFTQDNDIVRVSQMANFEQLVLDISREVL